MTRLAPALTALAALLAAPLSAAAEPRVASKGPYAEATVGATSFLGTGGDHSHLGPAFGLRGGIDVFSWFSIGIRAELENHEADVPPPPEGEYFQIYVGAVEGRISVPAGRITLFADGGAGVAAISTNVLSKVELTGPGERFSSVVSAGGGIEYQLENRHYAFGLAGQWNMFPGFDGMQSVGARLALRYTY